MRRFLSSHWPLIVVVASAAVLVGVILLCDWRIIIATGVILFLVGNILSAIWIANQQKKSQSLSMGQESDAPIDWAEKVSVTFDDVAGCDEAKAEVERFVQFLKDPTRYTSLGGTLPKGLLLIGQPGTGKTLLAKAMAGEANVPFGFANGANFVKVFVGQGPARVRGAFAELRKKKPCIFFIDEIDGLGSRSHSALHQEYNQTVNAILAEMDGFKSNEGILIIGATNKPESLDPALLRAGRFSKRAFVDLPDVAGREQILKVHAKKIILDKNTDLKEVAKDTPELPGSELANIINEAAIAAAERGAKAVEQRDLLDAIENTLYGPEKKSRVVIQEERKIAAYHESGHVLASKHTKEADPVRKVTIIPRGMSGGATQMIPEHDRRMKTKSFLLGQMVVAMGGRAAEMVIFNNESSGAKMDFQNATDIAKQMVCEFGMTEVGKRVYQMRSSFLGMFQEAHLDCSPEMQMRIDEKIDELLEQSYEEAVRIIKENKHQLEALVKALLEKETLVGGEINQVLASAT